MVRSTLAPIVSNLELYFELGGTVEIFNPYDLDHVARLNKWLEDKKRGICMPCPFWLVKTIKKSKKGIFAPTVKSSKL